MMRKRVQERMVPSLQQEVMTRNSKLLMKSLAAQTPKERVERKGGVVRVVGHVHVASLEAELAVAPAADLALVLGASQEVVLVVDPVPVVSLEAELAVAQEADLDHEVNREVEQAVGPVVGLAVNQEVAQEVGQDREVELLVVLGLVLVVSRAVGLAVAHPQKGNQRADPDQEVGHAPEASQEVHQGLEAGHDQSLEAGHDQSPEANPAVGLDHAPEASLEADPDPGANLEARARARAHDHDQEGNLEAGRDQEASLEVGPGQGQEPSQAADQGHDQDQEVNQEAGHDQGAGQEVAAAVLDRDQEVGPIQDPPKSAGGCYQILILTQGLRKGGERKSNARGRRVAVGVAAEQEVTLTMMLQNLAKSLKQRRRMCLVAVTVTQAQMIRTLQRRLR